MINGNYENLPSGQYPTGFKKKAETEQLPNMSDSQSHFYVRENENSSVKISIGRRWL
jgi:hypothetical protein